MKYFVITIAYHIIIDLNHLGGILWSLHPLIEQPESAKRKNQD